MGAVKSIPQESRYELEECIAVGGMGSVYRGKQRGAAGFQRTVAIKRTHAHVLAMPQAREMILREAECASAVRHPNVVSIDDVEQVGDELLMVMEYVEGSSLSQLLKSRRLPVDVVIAIILDACAGLHAIHTARSSDDRPLGLIHRDMSPQNILVGRDGNAKVTDFGIAKRLGDPKQTSKNMRRGKYGYMAPEYILASTATASSDVFALGVVLWEALAGRRLFDGETNADTLRKNLVATVPRLHSEIPAVTPAVDNVLAFVLAHEREDRCPSAAEFATRLRAAAPSIATRAEVALEVGPIMSGTRIPSVQRSSAVSARELRAAEPAPSEEKSSISLSVAVDAAFDALNESEPPRVSRRPTRPAPPTRDPRPSSHTFKAFRLSDRASLTGPLEPDDSSEEAPVRKSVDPLAVIGARVEVQSGTHAKEKPAKRSVRSIAIVAFAAIVVGVTGFIAYEGLASDTPVATPAAH